MFWTRVLGCLLIMAITVAESANDEGKQMHTQMLYFVGGVLVLILFCCLVGSVVSGVIYRKKQLEEMRLQADYEAHKTEIRKVIKPKDFFDVPAQKPPSNEMFSEK
ncbi:unnamed protein product [Bursaphelenchus okinawaensis]|uniref:Uncharacterized protein n=1 Tax=Bursaphelenchus okinawaensis TaxID=465554 RepID=A0A811JR99_9BILA|nr:unnamed protein product [Bursaphelenchus okinawaensis]CAG9079895.1 unnamed protein product [Bursaphelenchus okinawaensis]